MNQATTSVMIEPMSTSTWVYRYSLTVMRFSTTADWRKNCIHGAMVVPTTPTSIRR